MRRSLYIAVAFVAFAAGLTLSVGASPGAVDICSSLLKNATLRALPDTTITSAATTVGELTQPGAKKPLSDLPSFCRVTATLKPSPASDIKVEIWMPTAGWNGKLEGVGSGGLAGAISYSAVPENIEHASLVDAIKNGYAGVSTDTGHVENDRTWLANEEKEKDYGYRAIHGMSVTAKAAIQAFYGQPAKHSYFSGCSTGGGQALGEAQLYPEDYDGILAGAPQNYLTHSRAFDLFEYQLIHSTDPPVKLSKATLALVTKTVMKRCGSDYGADKDGFLSSDPRECWFGVEELLCKEGDDPANCLTAAQVKVVTKVYGEFILPRTNTEIFPGLPVGSEQPGGPCESGWAPRPYLGGSPFASSSASQFYALGVLQDPNADLRKVDVGALVQMADKKFPYVNHTSLNLDGFIQHGGKLFIFHGWDDPDISVYNSINYYSSYVDALQRKLHVDHAAALAEAQKSVRFFAVPGMAHCGGGPGPTNFDPLKTVDQWVDKNAVPDKIEASHVANGVKTFSRPLCPYPQSAAYSEKGDRKDAANWACVSEHWSFELYDRYFYAPELAPKGRE